MTRRGLWLPAAWPHTHTHVQAIFTLTHNRSRLSRLENSPSSSTVSVLLYRYLVTIVDNFQRHGKWLYGVHGARKRMEPHIFESSTVNNNCTSLAHHPKLNDTAFRKPKNNKNHKIIGRPTVMNSAQLHDKSRLMVQVLHIKVRDLLLVNSQTNLTYRQGGPTRRQRKY